MAKFMRGLRACAVLAMATVLILTIAPNPARGSTTYYYNALGWSYGDGWSGAATGSASIYFSPPVGAYCYNSSSYHSTYIQAAFCMYMGDSGGAGVASGWEAEWGTGTFSGISGSQTVTATYTPHIHAGVFLTSGTCSGSGTLTGDIYYNYVLKVTNVNTNTVVASQSTNIWSATGQTCSGSSGSFGIGSPSYYTSGAQTTTGLSLPSLVAGDTYLVYFSIGGSGDIQASSGSNNQQGFTAITMGNQTYNDYVQLNSFAVT
jgi:hypothetical protein